MDSVLHDKARRADLADCLRADAKRFAAHKAHYVERTVKGILNDDKTPLDQRQQMAQQAMRTFARWGETERNYAAHSTQMAEKWADFEDNGDRYLLQYRTANDERVREEHAVLHNTTLPINDPFWDTYYPPLGWNCRCTVVQVRRDKYQQSDSAQACQNGAHATTKQPSFRFNPGKTKKCFPDTVSYYKHTNNKQRKNLEHYFGNKVLRVDSKQTIKQYQGNTFELQQREQTIEVLIDAKTTNHLSNDVASNCNFLYNEIVRRLPNILKQSKCVGYELNTKLDKKPSAVQYLYYEYRIGTQTVYFNIEENFVKMGNRHFYRLYAITNKLREGVIKME